MTGCTVRRYEQLETSPETIEQELRPAVCEHKQTDRIIGASWVRKNSLSGDEVGSPTSAIP